MFAWKQTFSFPFLPPRWHQHVSPAAASLTAPRRCVVGLTKSVGAQLEARNESRQSRDYEPKGPLQIMAHYGRLLRASLWMEWMRSPPVCLLHGSHSVFYRSPKCAHQHQLSIDTRWFIDIAMFNPISSRAICSAQNHQGVRQTCFRHLASFLLSSNARSIVALPPLQALVQSHFYAQLAGNQ